MTTSDLYLKTAFCFMACDGNIAPEEVETMKNYMEKNNNENSTSSEIINAFITEINEKGFSFLQGYINDIKQSSLKIEEQLDIIKIAIDMIESDDVIEYDEIAFFKQMRQYLSITDNEILERFPDKEDYLLPDVSKDFDFNKNLTFNEVIFDLQ